jgi:hypothetical protein
MFSMINYFSLTVCCRANAIQNYRDSVIIVDRFFIDPESVGNFFAFELNELRPTNQQLEKFAGYLVENYIDDDAPFPPNIWSAKSASSRRTTNACESFHSHLNKCFSFSHPNIFVFLETIKQYQCEIYVQIQSVNSSKRLNTKTQKRENFIQENIVKFNNNQITILQYVKLTSHYFSF